MQLSIDRYSFQVPPKSLFPETYKIVIVGNFGAGKTALLWRFLHKDFASGIIDVVQKKITVKEKDIELEFWDTAGKIQNNAFIITNLVYNKPCNKITRAGTLSNYFSIILCWSTCYYNSI